MLSGHPEGTSDAGFGREEEEEEEEEEHSSVWRFDDDDEQAWGRATLRATIDVEEEAFLLLLSLYPSSFSLSLRNIVFFL